MSKEFDNLAVVGNEVLKNLRKSLMSIIEALPLEPTNQTIAKKMIVSKLYDTYNDVKNGIAKQIIEPEAKTKYFDEIKEYELSIKRKTTYSK